MNILLLGEKSSLIINNIKKEGHNAVIINDKINKETAILYDFIISFGYRYIIAEDVIKAMENKIINLHISYLPYNKGADPNLWSYLEDTPKGVTIHYIDKELDSGDILLQKIVKDNVNDTLKTSYNRLISEIVTLFNNNMNDLINNNIKATKQTNKGTIHYFKDKEQFNYLLEEKGYDTLVSHIKGKAIQYK